MQVRYLGVVIPFTEAQKNFAFIYKLKQNVLGVCIVPTALK